VLQGAARNKTQDQITAGRKNTKAKDFMGSQTIRAIGFIDVSKNFLDSKSSKTGGLIRSRSFNCNSTVYSFSS
jgi:hypothetical protein